MAPKFVVLFCAFMKVFRMLISLVVFGGVIFWIFVAIFFIIWMVLVSQDEYGGVVGLILGSLVLLIGFGDLEMTWISAKTNAGWLILGCLGYLGLGICYVFAPWVGRWWNYIKFVRNKNREVKTKWLADNGGRMTEELMARWKKCEKDYYPDITRPTAAESKGILGSWVLNWPAFLLVAVLSDPFGKICDFIYGICSSYAENVSIKLWRDEDNFGK